MRPRLLWIHSWPESLPGPVKSIENHDAAWSRTVFGCRKLIVFYSFCQILFDMQIHKWLFLNFQYKSTRTKTTNLFLHWTQKYLKTCPCPCRSTMTPMFFLDKSEEEYKPSATYIFQRFSKRNSTALTHVVLFPPVRIWKTCITTIKYHYSSISSRNKIQ
jgi:hypothetical protein